MSTTDSTTWNFSSHSRTRTHSVDYSRHLCGSARPKASMDKRPSKSFSDTDAIGLLSQTSLGRYHDLNEKNTKFVKQLASVERVSQKQVYNMDHSFHRKYGNKNEKLSTHDLPPKMDRWVNSPITSVLSYDMNVDDDARSFCDSVSSIACSNFASAEVDKERKSKDIFPDKVARFDAIETWLQHLSKPSF
ncbi:uncharacterized protein LOC144653640 [Oculina patagonica]